MSQGFMNHEKITNQIRIIMLIDYPLVSEERWKYENVSYDNVPPFSLEGSSLGTLEQAPI